MTVTVKLKVPGVVGMPVMAPVVTFKNRPEGRMPVETLQVSVPLPPVAARGCEYAVPTMPPGREVVVMETRAVI